MSTSEPRPADGAQSAGPAQSRAAEATPRPLGELPLTRLQAVRGVLTDIDDTLVSHGRLVPAAQRALADLSAAGLPVIAVTGRPAGWSLAQAGGWPVRAIVAENGGVLLQPDPAAEGGMRLSYSTDEATLARRQQRLSACLASVLAEVPQARPASDSDGRHTDIAIDHAEHAHLGAEDIQRVLAVMRRHGLAASVSSIHINGWIGGHDKATGAEWAVRSVLGHPFRPEDWIFIGDSPNDERLFDRVPLSVGVANIGRYLGQLAVVPAFITQAASGDGFAEMVARLLAARNGTPDRV